MSSTLRAGHLRDRVTLQNPPATDDGAGGQIGGWTTVAVLHAAVEPLGGSEAMNAGIETGITNYRITLRRRTFNTGQRLLWGTQALGIRAVLPDPNRAFMALLCEAVPA